MEKKSRIVLSVTNNWENEQRVNKVALSLIEMGFDVQIFAKKAKSPSIIAFPYIIHRINIISRKGIFFYFEYNFRLFFKLVKTKADYLVANDLDTLPANYFASIFKKNKLIFDAHEWFTEVPELIHHPIKKKIWLLIEFLTVRRSFASYTVCQPIANYYKETYGMDMKVIRNFPLCRINAIFKPVSILEKIKQFNKIILYQGAVNIGRGLETMILAMNYLPNFTLIIIGSGDIFEKLQILVDQNILRDKVIFIGQIPFAHLPEYTQYADLGISLEEPLGLSYYYSLPNKIFDYIQSGIPVLASDLPQIKHIIEKYQIGEVISECSPQLLANTIEQIFESKTLIPRWKNNLIKAASELIWENEKLILSDIYK